MIIALEGTDGSGKTSARVYLYNKIAEDTGKRPLSTPSFYWQDLESTFVIVESKYGEGIQDKNKIIDAYIKDKELFSKNIIKKSTCDNIILDRFIVSDIINLAISHDIDMDLLLESFNKSDIILPDLWIFIDTKPQLAYERVVSRKKGVNSWETEELIKRKYNLYNKIFNNKMIGGKVIKIINNDNKENLFLSLDNIIKQYIEK